jgi:hypothetical protein
MIKAIWQRIITSLKVRTRYARALEEEIARLRAENRALINSILGVAGIPPMRVATREAAAIALHSREDGFVGARLASPGRPEGRPYKKAATTPEAGVRATTSFGEMPLRSVRRRSWKQIGRALEIEDARAARRERESDTETFPTPRNAVVRERL